MKILKKVTRAIEYIKWQDNLDPKEVAQIAIDAIKEDYVLVPKNAIQETD